MYQHQPLTDRQDLRLVKIYPAAHNEEIVSCSVISCSFTDLPAYEALSYTWGDSSYSRSIIVDGKEFPVTSNLANALECLRGLTDFRLFWVDALCINMHDTQERSAQIKVMNLIFGHAANVRVWLGNSLPYTRVGFEVLNDARGALDGKEYSDIHEQLNSCAEIFLHPWFTKVWTLQEFAVAKRVTFQNGIYQIDLEAFIESADFLGQLISTPSFSGSQDQIQIDWIKSFLSRLGNFTMTRALRNKYNESTCMGFIAFATILSIAQGLSATNPSDRVYGVYALAPASFKEDFSPDYELPVSQVYKDLALYMESQLVHIETSIEIEYLNNTLNLCPVWVVDWIDSLLLLSAKPFLGQIGPIDPQSILSLVLGALSYNSLPTDETVLLSTNERITYKEDLRNAFREISIMLSMLSSTRYITSTEEQDDEQEVSPSTEEPDDEREGYPKMRMLNDVNFSDSGYSTASSLQGDNALVATEIAAYLLDHDFFRALLSKAALIETREDALERQLRPRIKFYGQELEKSAGESKELLVARELRRHAPFIARAIITRNRAGRMVEDETLKRQREARVETLLKQQSSSHQTSLRNYFTDIQEGFRDAESNNLGDGQDTDEQIRDEAPQLQMSKSALREVKHFMISDIAFTYFLHLICYMIYSDPLEFVKSEVYRCVGGMELQGTFSVTFDVPSELGTFLDQEAIDPIGILNPDRVLSLLVISGTPQACYATSCVSYLEWKWPNTSKFLVDAIRGQVNIRTNPTWLFFLRPTGKDKDFQISAHGTKEFLVEVAQQIVWLATAFRIGIEKKLCISEVLFHATDECVFKISNLPLKEVEMQDYACWIPLFPGMAIAHEYPIPDRGHETGIELPFQLMSTLVGPLYPMYHDGGIYLKGSSRLLFPTAISSSGAIQWHLICNNNAGEVIPPDAIHQQKWVKIGSSLQLTQARTFLGYCREIVIDLGTHKPTEYYKNILFSGLGDEQHGPSIGIPSFTAGTGGLPFNVGLNIPITQTKALIQSANSEQDYSVLLDDAKSRPVIVYDTIGETGRGWMVPAVSVILHMIHTWTAKFESISEGFPHADLTTNAGNASRKTLFDNSNFILRRSANQNIQKDKVVKDLVLQFWNSIIQRRWQELDSMSLPHLHLEIASRKLYGWEYMDIVVNKHCRRKQLYFSSSWGQFAEDCTIIVGKGLGDLIQPAAGVTVCGKWNPIKSNKWFLTATISCLQILACERGGSAEQLTSSRLTNKGYWHYQSDELFSDCQDCDQRRCRKKPQHLQSSIQQLTLELIPPLGGAVVFGESKLEKFQTKRKIAVASSDTTERHNIVDLFRNAKRFIGRRGDLGGSSPPTPSHSVQSDSSIHEEDGEEE